MVKQRRAFNPKTFLSTEGVGRKMMLFRKGQKIYAQGERADALFAIQKGTVKVSVKSHGRKGTTLSILSDRDFVGEDSVAGKSCRTGSADAITDCRLLRIDKQAMMLALTRHKKLAEIFLAYVLERNARYEQDLLDQRCNPCEKRLARILLLLARGDRDGVPATIPNINHETLSEIVGTTRSRVCFFMSRFKQAGFIDYGHKGNLLRVNRTLLAFCSQ